MTVGEVAQASPKTPQGVLYYIHTKGNRPMTTTIPNHRYNEAIRRLADGFSSEFAEFCAGDERIHEYDDGPR